MICRMPKSLSSIVVLLCAACCAVGFDARAQNNRTRSENDRREERAAVVFLDSTKEIDGLKGPVRRIETEIMRVQLESGKLVPKSRSLLERTLYDELGRRIENETYPIVGNQAGQETHKYDAQGNLSETIVREAGGAVSRRTIYEYELDRFGNWIMMKASVAVSKSGKVEYEPVEITKRNITYYQIDEIDEPDASGSVTGAARTDASVAPVAEGDRVSRRVEAADAKKPRAILPGTPLAEGALLNAGSLNNRTDELPKPSFPVSWKRLDEPVTVTVEVVVDITGRVVEAKAQDGLEALREPAESAARRATFLPFYVAGRPVRARGSITYTFDFLP